MEDIDKKLQNSLNISLGQIDERLSSCLNDSLNNIKQSLYDDICQSIQNVILQQLNTDDTYTKDFEKDPHGIMPYNVSEIKNLGEYTFCHVSFSTKRQSNNQNWGSCNSNQPIQYYVGLTNYCNIISSAYKQIPQYHCGPSMSQLRYEMTHETNISLSDRKITFYKNIVDLLSQIVGSNEFTFYDGDRVCGNCNNHISQKVSSFEFIKKIFEFICHFEQNNYEKMSPYTHKILQENEQLKQQYKNYEQMFQEAKKIEMNEGQIIKERTIIEEEKHKILILKKKLLLDKENLKQERESFEKYKKLFEDDLKNSEDKFIEETTL